MRGRDHIDRFLPLSTVEAFERDRAAERAAAQAVPVRSSRTHPSYGARILPGGCTLYSIFRAVDGGNGPKRGKGPCEA